MSEYPDQPRPRDGWPSQPPLYTKGAAGGQAGFGQDGHPQAGFGQDGRSLDGLPQDGYRQDSYGRAAAGQAAAGQAGYREYGPRGPRGVRGARRRRRRGRKWIALLSTLAVLAVLFVIGDQVAKAYAENMIADKIQSSAGLSAKPSVTIEGFPFLTQVAEHDVRTIDISASNIQTGKLVISTVSATATGVHLNSSFNGATIDHISGTALITFASLVNATGAHGVTIAADPSAGPNAANVSVGPLSATALVTQTAPNKITVKVGGLAAIAASLLGELPDYTFTVPKLPAGLQLQGVAVTNQGIAIKVGAQNTTLSQ